MCPWFLMTVAYQLIPRGPVLAKTQDPGPIDIQSFFHILQTMGDMYAAVAWAKNTPDGGFEQIEIQRNVAGDDDVTFDVKFCGICHTDVHISNNDMVNNQILGMKNMMMIMTRV